MPVMPRTDEARRTLLIEWLASIGLTLSGVAADLRAALATAGEGQ